MGEPRLERLAKTVTECKSEFEWVVCVVNDVLRRSVKIHMDIPPDFFFFLPEAFDAAVSVMDPYTSVLVDPASPRGTLGFTRGDNQMLKSAMGIYSSTAWHQ